MENRYDGSNRRASNNSNTTDERGHFSTSSNFSGSERQSSASGFALSLDNPRPTSLRRSNDYGGGSSVPGGNTQPHLHIMHRRSAPQTSSVGGGRNNAARADSSAHKKDLHKTSGDRSSHQSKIDFNSNNFINSSSFSSQGPAVVRVHHRANNGQQRKTLLSSDFREKMDNVVGVAVVTATESPQRSASSAASEKLVSKSNNITTTAKNFDFSDGVMLKIHQREKQPITDQPQKSMKNNNNNNNNNDDDDDWKNLGSFDSISQFRQTAERNFQTNSSNERGGGGSLCPRCHRCRCSDCLSPRPLPSTWLCGGCCLCSAEKAVDVLSCACCVKGCLYHWSGRHRAECNYDGGQLNWSGANNKNNSPMTVSKSDTASTRPDRTGMPEAAAYALACPFLPCLCCYWPLKGLVAGLGHLYAYWSDNGCRCDESQQKRAELRRRDGVSRSTSKVLPPLPLPAKDSGVNS